MAYLSARQISKEFNGVRVLDDVSIDIELGRFHILAGENGAGKSTLVKILTGVHAPTTGSVSIDGENPEEDRSRFDRVAYVPQELTLFQNMTVAENLFMPFTKTGHGGPVVKYRQIARDAQALIDRFNIHARPNQRVSDISVSDRQLLQIARAASRTGFKVLILDEPTSSLTKFETDRLFAVLRRLADTGHAIVFISHKMDEIFELGQDITVLRNGRLVRSGPLSDLDERGLLTLMAGTEVMLDNSFTPDCAPRAVLLKVENVSGAGFKDVSFELHGGEILGFAGLVGAGRSEAFQAIFGYRKRTAGRVVLCGEDLPANDPVAAAARGLVYLPEERSLHGIFAHLSLHDNIALSLFGDTARGGLISSARENAAVQGVIDAYEIKTSSNRKHIRFLSGGNQQKAVIGRAIARNPKVLIFDEPTKGIDVRTKLQIYTIMKSLAEQGMGIVLISSDLVELKHCASRIVTMHSGSVSGTFASSDFDQNVLMRAIFGRKEADHVNV